MSADVADIRDISPADVVDKHLRICRRMSADVADVACPSARHPPGGCRLMSRRRTSF
jgi:hypothetical protein